MNYILFFYKLKRKSILLQGRGRRLHAWSIYFLILFPTVIAPVFGQAQQCNCAAAFDSVRNYLTRNYAGFQDKTGNNANQRAYLERVAEYSARAKKIRSQLYCFDLVDQWLNSFRDHHLYLQLNASSPHAPKLMAAEKFALTAGMEAAAKKPVPLALPEGIYRTPDTSYRVLVVKNQNTHRDYAGVLLSTKVPGWQRGDVKFQFKLDRDGTYRVIWQDRDHRPSFSNISFTGGNGLQQSGWLKENVATTMTEGSAPGQTSGSGNVTAASVAPAIAKTQLFPEERMHSTYFKIIDSSTAYLRIQSFGAAHRVEIDSVVNTNLSLIEATPRLIIDLRYNGGGADISYRPLKRLIYTNPVKTVGVDVVATKENLDIYAQMIRAAELPPADEKEYLGILEQARNSGQRLYNFYPDQFDTIGVVLKYPSVVAVIMNEKVGSTAEEFLLEARQSKKVKLFGNHSQGVLDYANVCVKAFECFPFDLHYPISRSRRIDQGAGIDNVGIKPDVPVDLSREDWFQQVLQRM